MMNSAGTESSLRDFEASSFAQQDVFGGDADVDETEFGVARGGVVVPKNGQRANDLQTCRRDGDSFMVLSLNKYARE